MRWALQVGSPRIDVCAGVQQQLNDGNSPGQDSPVNRAVAVFVADVDQPGIPANQRTDFVEVIFADDIPQWFVVRTVIKPFLHFSDENRADVVSPAIVGQWQQALPRTAGEVGTRGIGACFQQHVNDIWMPGPHREVNRELVPDLMVHEFRIGCDQTFDDCGVTVRSCNEQLPGIILQGGRF